MTISLPTAAAHPPPTASAFRCARVAVSDDTMAQRVAILSAGGLAPCLSSAIGCAHWHPSPPSLPCALSGGQSLLLRHTCSVTVHLALPRRRFLIEMYTELAPDVEIICYKSGAGPAPAPTSLVQQRPAPPPPRARPELRPPCPTLPPTRRHARLQGPVARRLHQGQRRDARHGPRASNARRQPHRQQPRQAHEYKGLRGAWPLLPF